MKKLNNYRCRLKGQRGRGRNVESTSSASAAESFFDEYGKGRTSDNTVIVDGKEFQLTIVWTAKAVKQKKP